VPPPKIKISPQSAQRTRRVLDINKSPSSTRLIEGRQEGSFSKGIQKSSPAFEKGRTGGISEKGFQSGNPDRKIRANRKKKKIAFISKIWYKNFLFSF
jgi:hypothetical protein